ncbi:molybdopterin molybdotransferase MoeA [Maridesulfovibrio frigidus]|uniref:molybdopterin molybdotransferase MoeA n=1 Tax=Maridesulfovibrio frigidus TaxID=340956 RepID=UPI0004E2087D|nr:molybdopterin molybdotransferase MoeA [Maridesulfovibrio frigidus]
MQKDIKKDNSPFPKKITRQQALAIIEKQLSPITEQLIPVAESCDCVSAETIFSDVSMPEHDRSAMDGFAIASALTATASVESPVTFTISGEVRPSPSKIEEQPEKSIQSESFSATKILTGGIIPDHADAIIPFENVSIFKDKISVTTPVGSGPFIRKEGSDILNAEIIVSENELISACTAALLAYTGKYHIRARVAPSVAVLAVGNELCDPSKTCKDGLIPADNLILVKGLCESNGTGPVKISPCENSPEAIAKAIKENSDCDLIITTGGTGPGNRDFVFNSIYDGGGKPLFKGLAMHPAKSIFAFKMNDTAIIGLPGPPNAVHLAFHSIIKPVINILLGQPEKTETTTAILADSIRVSKGREKLIPCRLESKNGIVKAVPIDHSKLSSRRAMCLANAIIISPAGSNNTEAGSIVEVLTMK